MDEFTTRTLEKQLKNDEEGAENRHDNQQHSRCTGHLLLLTDGLPRFSYGHLTLLTMGDSRAIPAAGYQRTSTQSVEMTT
ncbi:MAG TPA: hypothetical protein VHA53_08045 [Nitrolancea sp.]|nr:hypothetical protein [Nitrolancea sp.]